MRKVLSILFLLVSMVLVASAWADTVEFSADSIPYSQLSVQELREIAQRANLELLQRVDGTSEIILFSQDGCVVYATGNMSIGSSWQGKSLEIEVIIDNQTNDKQQIREDYWSVNGWSTFMNYSYPVAPKSKKKTTLSISLKHVDGVTTVSDVYTISGKLRFLNKNNYQSGFTFSAVQGQIVPNID